MRGILRTQDILIWILIPLALLISCQQNRPKMSLTTSQIVALESLLHKYKFSDKDWEARGLIPSDKSLSDKMNNLINDCLSDLINSQGKNLTQKDFRKILNKGLKRFKKIEYDTEGREFIVDKFDQISKIIGIDYSEELTNWLYGKPIANMFNKFNKSDLKSLESITIKCTNCQDTLTKEILIFKEQIPEYWTIVKCNNCEELNIFPAMGNIKEARFINCTWLKSYPRTEFDSVQIISKLNELKTNITGN